MTVNCRLLQLSDVSFLGIVIVFVPLQGLVVILFSSLPWIFLFVIFHCAWGFFSSFGFCPRVSVNCKMLYVQFVTRLEVEKRTLSPTFVFRKSH